MNGNVEQVETVIIGGGHAGLTMSYYLTQAGREHVILERGQVGERWRIERWDSFRFNFPNWALLLPGYKYQGSDLDAFAPGYQVVKFLEDYASFIKAPLRSGVTVASLGQQSGSNRYVLDLGDLTIEASNVVIATGPFQRPAIPQTNIDIPNSIFQVHSNNYRNPDQLPPGAVLVVGAGSSGCQIADELRDSGRAVYLSVGQHRRVPRRYRGHDYVWWRWKMGAWDRRADSLSPAEKNAPVPLLTGVDGGYDVNLRRMAAQGITLLGHLDAVTNDRLILAPGLKDNLSKGDKWFGDFKNAVDVFVQKGDMEIEDNTQVDDDFAEPKEVTAPVLEMALKSVGIKSIVWSSGYRYDFDWVRLPLFDESGEPSHVRGVTRVPGIYFLGLQWLYKLKSAFLSLGGPGEDAAYLAEQIAARHSESASRSS
jgi:putative flavoprotein involved in K+ transport